MRQAGILRTPGCAHATQHRFAGTAFQTSATVPAGSVSIEFLFYIGDGSGADGISLTALDVNRMSGFLGSSGVSAMAVCRLDH